MRIFLLSGIASGLLLTTNAFAYDFSFFKGWDTNIEAGALYSSGNTDKENLNAAITMNKDGEINSWGHTVKASAKNSKDEDVRNEEEYKISTQSRYNIDEESYNFLELEYVKDRFSGYDYRTTENVGYGRKFINSEYIKIAGEASVGMRQTKDETGKNENSALLKLAGKVNWQLNEHTSISEDLSVAIADSTITLSETALKNALSENMYLKLAVTMEHNSKVPAGTDNTDTTTSINIGYKF